MRFWDSSAILPLLVNEKDSPLREKQLSEDREMLVWFSTTVECVSALSRRVREGSLSMSHFDLAEKRLKFLAASWVEVAATAKIQDLAWRLLRVHPLRAADALQLSSALAVCQSDPNRFSFLTSDDRLAMAAKLEGFDVG